MTTSIIRRNGLHRRRAGVSIAMLLLLAACGTAAKTNEPGPPVLDETQAIDLAWQALEPNTASHDRANWAVVEARQVEGRSVADEFEGWVFYGYCGGPEPTPNRQIEPLKEYWYVEFEPQPATPSGPSLSPTAPPLVPEPFMVRAALLLDKYGTVIARMLTCVVY